jgi:hypothetical protein
VRGLLFPISPLLCAFSTLLSYITTLIAGFALFGLCVEGLHQLSRDAAMAHAFRHSLLSRGYDTVRAANRGNASSQYELGRFHYASAIRLDMFQGAPADDDMVDARLALRH